MPKRLSWRPIAAISILIVTIWVFVSYFINHPGVWQQLGEIPKTTIMLVLGLYLIFTVTLAMINDATLRLCKKRMAAGESLLLTMYSSVINFFGPLQSGPAFRAIYVKQKHAIKIKDYTLASFVYYFFYALFSSILLFSSLLKWWLIPITTIIIFGLGFIRRAEFGKFKTLRGLSLENWEFMALATFAQVSMLFIIFSVQLSAVDPGITASQVAVYTGAANLALFVSFTPGAIGFRESFLVFTQRLHHISNSTIIAANTIDRAVYVLMLLILAVIIVATHARQRLKVNLE